MLEREKPKSEIGGITIPHFVDITQGNKTARWVGVGAYYNGEVKEFLWWRNLKVSLANEESRRDPEMIIERLKLRKGISAVIGLPLDLSASNLNTGSISVIDQPGLAGIYIEAGIMKIAGIKPSIKPSTGEGKFNRLLRKAKSAFSSQKNL